VDSRLLAFAISTTVRVLRVVISDSRRGASAEQKYDTYDLELLTIVQTLTQWRHYLEGANHDVSIQ